MTLIVIVTLRLPLWIVRVMCCSAVRMVMERTAGCREPFEGQRDNQKGQQQQCAESMHSLNITPGSSGLTASFLCGSHPRWVRLHQAMQGKELTVFYISIIMEL
ncbi:MAG: hypothetical protein ABIS68_03875 [Casimicrobiaceae bacterium]